MTKSIPHTPSLALGATGILHHLQPGSHETVTQSDSVQASGDQAPTSSRFRRSLFRTARFRFGLAASGILAVGAAFWFTTRKRAHSVSIRGDQEVEDFTANQQAMLRRIREIWNEHSADTESAENGLT
jgi:hypothetical protein